MQTYDRILLLGNLLSMKCPLEGLGGHIAKVIKEWVISYTPFVDEFVEKQFP